MEGWIVAILIALFGGVAIAWMAKSKTDKRVDDARRQGELDNAAAVATRRKEKIDDINDPIDGLSAAYDMLGDELGRRSDDLDSDPE